jgi:hypothetical protein
LESAVDITGSAVDITGSAVDITGSGGYYWQRWILLAAVDITGSAVDITGSAVDMTCPLRMSSSTTSMRSVGRP